VGRINSTKSLNGSCELELKSKSELPENVNMVVICACSVFYLVAFMFAAAFLQIKDVYIEG